MIIEFDDTEYKLGFSFLAVVTLTLAISNSFVVLSSLLVSILHECGHLFFMYKFQDKPSRVTLGAFGVRIEKIETVSLSYQQEAIISLGGVLVNFSLCTLSLICFYITRDRRAIEFFLVNLFIALLNLIPIQMLDAGRFLKYMFLMKYSEERTKIITEKISFIAVCTFAILCVGYTFFLGINISLLCVLIYLIIADKKWR